MNEHRLELLVPEFSGAFEYLSVWLCGPESFLTIVGSLGSRFARQARAPTFFAR